MHNAQNFFSTQAELNALDNVTSPLTFDVGSVMGAPSAPAFLVVQDGTPEEMEMTALSSSPAQFTVIRRNPVAHAGTPTVACDMSAGYLQEIQAALSGSPGGTGHVIGGFTYTYKRAVVISNGGAALTNVPLRISLGVGNFNFSRTQTNGWDIQFTDSTGTVLDYFVQSWDATNQVASLFVLVPSVAATGNTTVWMYYSSPAAVTTSSAPSVFSGATLLTGTSPVAAWDLDLSSFAAGVTVPDQTGNGHIGTLLSGIIASGGRFNGAAATMNRGECMTFSAMSMPTNWSAAGWFSSIGSDDPGALLDTSDGTGFSWVLGWRNNVFYMGNPGIEHNYMGAWPTDSSWHHWAAVLSGNNLTMYCDGSSVGSVTSSNTVIWSPAGTPYGGALCAVGNGAVTMDSLQLYTSLLSPSQISALANPAQRTVVAGPNLYLHTPPTIPLTYGVGSEQVAA